MNEGNISNRILKLSIYIKNNGALRTIILLAYIVILIGVKGCSIQPVPPVPTELIENLTIADMVNDIDYLIYHTFGIEGGSPELTKFPQQEIELLRQMLESNYSAEFLYSGNKATIIVDTANSGIMEWFHINKLHWQLREGELEQFRYKVLCMQYIKGRWYNIDILTLNRQLPEGWPSGTEEFLEAYKQNR